MAMIMSISQKDVIFLVKESQRAYISLCGRTASAEKRLILSVITATNMLTG